MSRQNIVIVICVVVITGLVVWFVSPNREEMAKADLDVAYKVEQAGQSDQAVTLYEKLIAEYAGTKAADLAADYILRVDHYKERKLIQEVRKNIERVALVMNGYREMMGAMPASIGQLDSGEYMFDSDYIAEIVPEGYTYYLRFEPATTSFTVFSVRTYADKAVMSDAAGNVMAISRSDFEREISQEGLERITRGRMVFLQPPPG